MGKMDDYTRYQQGIIRRFYDNHDTILLQRLAELTSDLYLAEGKKRQQVWKSLAATMLKLGLKPARVDQIVAADDPAQVAGVVKELNAQK